MENEKKQIGKEKDECNLCKVSDEAIKTLKEKGQPFKEIAAKNKKRIPWKIKAVVSILVIGLAALIFWELSSKNQERVPEVLLKTGVSIGNLAPDFVSEDVDGNRVALGDFRGKEPVLLVFWATWCGYCAKELPDLKAFTQEHQDKIQVIAVDSGEARETIRNYIQEKEINFLILLDEQKEIWNNYLVRGTPSHFLINKQGKIVTLVPGLALKENLETMLTMLREL